MSPGTLKRIATEDGSISPPPTKRKIQTTTTNKAVANFFKPVSQKEPSKASWRIVENSLLVCRYDRPDEHEHISPRKVAAFDLDSTLISTLSGNKFSKDATDWKWWHHHVEGRLRDLVKEGYRVVIVSNQGGVTLPDPTSKTAKSDGRRLNDFKTKAAAVLTALDLPIRLYAATKPDLYRKPRSGMWNQLITDYPLTPETIDIEGSFFVGDAGGRPATGNSGVLKDFSCSDRDFAANAGIAFHTPEEFFLGEDVRPFVRTFDPAAFVNKVDATAITTQDPIAFRRKHDRELVIFVGSPGAGKSTFFWERLEPLGYERVNQDILKTRDKCIKAASDFLRDGKSVAVDNTNADIDVRAHWIKLAAEHDVPVRCVLFTAPAKLCEHNDTVRALGGTLMNRESRTMLPKMAFSGFASRYREPSLKEGFEDITKVNFTFQGSEEQKVLWGRYWISG